MITHHLLLLLLYRFEMVNPGLCFCSQILIIALDACSFPPPPPPLPPLPSLFSTATEIDPYSQCFSLLAIDRLHTPSSL